MSGTNDGAGSSSGGMSGRTKGIIVVVVLLVLALVVVPAIAHAFDKGPKEWLDQNYDRVSGDDPKDETVTYASDDDLDTTVNRIVAGTDPDDQTEGDDTESQTVYLRYDSDWIVKVSDDGDGTSIELDEFDRGYSRHGAFVAVWGGFYNRGGGLFRGGGSGFGK